MSSPLTGQKQRLEYQGRRIKSQKEALGPPFDFYYANLSGKLALCCTSIGAPTDSKRVRRCERG